MGVSKTFQHAVRIIPRAPRSAALEQRFDFALENVLAGEAGMRRADLPVA
jgi:hypothetical protein